jgi:hypothetical protein
LRLLSARSTKGRDARQNSTRHSFGIRFQSVVIARSEATKQSIRSSCGSMDCFATLAMTKKHHS